MTYDRYGGRVDLDARQPGSCTCPRRRACPCVDPRCRRGWLGNPDADQPKPCLACRPHLRGGTTDIRIGGPHARPRRNEEPDVR